MHIKPLLMEDWFINHSFSAKYNLAESGMRDLLVGELFELCGIDIETIKDISLANMDTRGSQKLREAISSTYSNVDADNVLVTTGMSEALFILFNEILEPNDSVIVMFPSFQPLSQIPKSIGCNVNFLNLEYEKNYRMNLSMLDDMITSSTKLLILNSPHNPTGAVIPEEYYSEICQICEKHGTRLLVDEHYRFLPLDERLVIPSVVDFNNKAMVTGSITKCFGTAGLRMGWIIAQKEIVDRCRMYKDYLTHVLSPITDFIATTAIKNRQVVLKRNSELVRRNKNLFSNFVSQHSDFLNWIPPEGGAVCFPKYRFDISPDDFCKKLIERESVFLLPGSCFQKGNFFRLCLGVEEQLFSEAIEGLGRYLHWLLENP